MPTVTSLTDAAPPAVWAVLSDVRRWPEWLPTVTSVEPVGPERPGGIGAAYRLVQPRLRPAMWTITDWTPGRGFTWVSLQPGVASRASHSLAPTASGGTEITLEVGWSGPMSWFARTAYGRLTAMYLRTEATALGAFASAAGS